MAGKKASKTDLTPAPVAKAPTEDAPTAPTVAGRRRARIVLYKSAAKATSKAKASQKAKEAGDKQEAAKPERNVVSVFHLTDCTTPQDAVPRARVQKEGDNNAYTVHLGDKLQHWVFSQAVAYDQLELEYYEPGAEEPRTLAVQKNTFCHCNIEMLAGMLYLFLRLEPTKPGFVLEPQEPKGV